MVIRDTDLSFYVQCPLFQETRPDPYFKPTQETFRWAVRERHAGIIRSASDIRERFIRTWNAEWSGVRDGLDYWAGPKAAVGLGRRLNEFLLKYRIQHPFEPYKLELEEGTIEGDFALALWDKSRKPEMPMVVETWIRRPRDTRVPSYGALARWLAARQTSDSVDLGIVHVAALWGESAITQHVDEVLATKWLNAILKAAQDPFPRVCNLCPVCTHPCKEVYRGQNDDHWD